MKNDFSVVIATFNPDYNKLFYTINSIIRQHNCEYEIIISDDGSLDFDIDIINKYFEKVGFKKYLILANKKNEGTVKNFIKGIEKATGKYIKLLSPR